jgi:hypothetical protein
MSTAILTPLTVGCIVELDGIARRFPSYAEARREIDALGVGWVVEPVRAPKPPPAPV